MTTSDAWQSLVTDLAEIRGPTLSGTERGALRTAVERYADDARTRGLAAEAMIKELRTAFAESSLSVTRETYLRNDSHDDDQLVTKMVSWALTQFFVPHRGVGAR
jgi:hypothetical protein